MKPQSLIILASMIFLSCEKSDDRSLEHKASDSSDPTSSRLLDDGAIDGGAWTLAQFSDFFDEGITKEKVKETFGSDPLIRSDGDMQTFVYAVGSNKMYDFGSRIHTIRIYFQGEKFLNVELGSVSIRD